MSIYQKAYFSQTSVTKKIIIKSGYYLLNHHKPPTNPQIFLHPDITIFNVYDNSESKIYLKFNGKTVTLNHENLYKDSTSSKE